MRKARRAFRRVACAMTRASACGSSWLSVESRRVALATIATPSRADAPRRRPVAAVRHAIAAEAPATHWAGRQKARAALASATRLMSESDRASFAAYDVEFVVEISRCRAPLHRSTTEALSPAADVELYSSTALQSALHLYSSTALYTLHPLHPPSDLVPLLRPACRRWSRAREIGVRSSPWLPPSRLNVGARPRFRLKAAAAQPSRTVEKR